MKDSKFDDLIRNMGKHPTYRRSLLKLLTGGVVSVALTLAGRSDTAAKRSTVGGICGRKSQKRIKGKKRRRGKKTTCFPDARCHRGRCRCRAGRRDCNGDGRCEDLAVSTDHCGACGVTCGLGEGCCGGLCTDIRDNREHCGACGVRCGDNERCNDGQCRQAL